MGDGYFYLPVLVWPESTTRLVLVEAWTTIG